MRTAKTEPIIREIKIALLFDKIKSHFLYIGIAKATVAGPNKK